MTTGDGPPGVIDGIFVVTPFPGDVLPFPLPCCVAPWPFPFELPVDGLPLLLSAEFPLPDDELPFPLSLPPALPDVAENPWFTPLLDPEADCEADMEVLEYMFNRLTAPHNCPVFPGQGKPHSDSLVGTLPAMRVFPQ